MSSTVYLTPEGLQKLKDDLHHAKTVERPKISQDIAEARAYFEGIGKRRIRRLIFSMNRAQWFVACSRRGKRAVKMG